jgi:hypothetical protein
LRAKFSGAKLEAESQQKVGCMVLDSACTRRFLNLVQAAATSAARIAQLESDLEKKASASTGADVDGLRKQLLEAEARAKIAEQRAADAAAAAAAAGKQAKDREKAVHDAAAKDVEHLKGEVVSNAAAAHDDGGGNFSRNLYATV